MTFEAPAVASVKWWLVIAIWSGIGLFEATQTVVEMRGAGMHHAWTALFLLQWLAWLPWALATPAILRVGARTRSSWQRWRSARGWSAWGLHLLAWLGADVAWCVWIAGLERVLNPWTPDVPSAPYAKLLRVALHEHWLVSLILYCGVLMAGAVLDSRERLARQRAESAELAGQLAQAQLDALRHQVEPHFLFNALNAVSGLVRDGQNDRAVETIARVSDFLRRMLQATGEQQVALVEELRFATMYLDIQKVRLGDRLAVRIDVAPDLDHAIVPRLILQPIVENAIKHGIGCRVQPGAVEIAAFRADDRLVLTLYNDGPPLRAAHERPGADGVSIGLANVRRRLAGLHGDAASLSLVDVDQRGVLVTVSLPFARAAR